MARGGVAEFSGVRGGVVEVVAGVLENGVDLVVADRRSSSPGRLDGLPGAGGSCGDSTLGSGARAGWDCVAEQVTGLRDTCS